MATKRGPGTCSVCKGSGEVMLQIAELGKPGVSSMRISCQMCGGVGVLSAAKLRRLAEEKAMWCQCGGSGPEGPVFYADDEHVGCIQKHHYHCSRCGKIEQVG